MGLPGLSYNFPACPETRGRVEACAIPEPLKVRMITKGESSTWCLKPLQRAMWSCLQKFKCFELTGGKPINLEHLDTSQPVPKVTPEALEHLDRGSSLHLLSGDYEAATDNLHLDILLAARDVLSEVVTDPKLRRFMERELSGQEVHYPKSSGLPPCVQTRGQLMGSLLSFPLLCVANATTVMRAFELKDLKELPAAINGDDVLFRADEKVIRKWKCEARSCGLKPSIGKNYQHPRFGSINSQLVEFHAGGFEVIPTGKFRCLTGSNPSKVTTALTVFPKAICVVKLRDALKLTPQSIEVPVDHGGLGLRFTETRDYRADILAKQVYLFKALSCPASVICRRDEQIKVRLPAMALHTIGLSKTALETINEPVDWAEYQSLPNKVSDAPAFDLVKFSKFQRNLRKTPALDACARLGNLRSFPPLSWLKPVELWVSPDDEACLSTVKERISSCIASLTLSCLPQETLSELQKRKDPLWMSQTKRRVKFLKSVDGVEKMIMKSVPLRDPRASVFFDLEPEAPRRVITPRPPARLFNTYAPGSLKRA